MATKMEKRINEVLTQYIDAMEVYLKTGNPSESDLNTIVGAFEYIINSEDFVPDDVPNVGLLDDLLVVLESANNLVVQGKLPFSSVDHSKIVEEFNQQKAMLYNMPVDISLNALSLRGQSKLKTSTWEEILVLVRKDLKNEEE